MGPGPGPGPARPRPSVRAGALQHLLPFLIEHWKFEKSDLGQVWKHDLVYFQTYLKCCVFFKLVWKNTPSQGAAAPWGAAEGGARGIFFQTSLKNTQYFKYVWKYTKSCFQTCPKSDFSNFQCSMRDASYQLKPTNNLLNTNACLINSDV